MPQVQRLVRHNYRAVTAEPENSVDAQIAGLRISGPEVGATDSQTVMLNKENE